MIIEVTALALLIVTIFAAGFLFGILAGTISRK